MHKTKRLINRFILLGCQVSAGCSFMKLSIFVMLCWHFVLFLSVFFPSIVISWSLEIQSSPIRVKSFEILLSVSSSWMDYFKCGSWKVFNLPLKTDKIQHSYGIFQNFTCVTILCHEIFLPCLTFWISKFSEVSLRPLTF